MNQIARRPLTIVLGAGASRSVSYAHKGGHPSPLDADFFDLLQRLKPAPEDREAVKSVIEQARALPHECWCSMERAFYTLHLRAYMTEKLTGEVESPSDVQVVGDFARCVQALLRKAHGKSRCGNHSRMLKVLGNADTVISFNYDLIAERAIRRVAEARSVEFGPFLYGLANRPATPDLPMILKLHGSSNWRVIRNEEDEHIEVRTKSWDDLDDKPGYRGHLGEGTVFPIFLPFWDKRIERGAWLPMWQEAFRRLRSTKRLLVWGYSLPTTDIKAQQLFALALSDAPVDLCVIDPSPATRDRWRALLPKARYWEYENIKEFFSQPPLWWPRPAKKPAGQPVVKR